MISKIVLVGMPTSGKSKTAGILAQALHVSWVDTDLVIEKRFGHKISWIFNELGEDGFRALEYQVVLEALQGPAQIISLGGGAPVYAPTRELLAGHTVYYLKASPDYLADRQEKRSSKSSQKKDQQVRPLLEGDVRGRMRKLYEERKDVYEALADVVIDAQRGRQDMAADIVAHQSREGDVCRVGGPKPYRVSFGRDLCAQVCDMVPASARKALILVAPPVVSLAKKLSEALEKTGRSTRIVTLPEGEAAKQLSALSSVWDQAANFGVERGDVVIPIGGGATTDLGGFAGATWLRGVDVVQVPTTLLAMVDAAIGGKTGINHSTGKNLVGAFYPPIGVAMDFTTLSTLPIAHVREGLAEALKCGFIRDPEILELAQGAKEELLDVKCSALTEIIRRAVAVKADVVSQDLYESGIREHLNFGHTLAHAIERAQNYGFAHGLAVSIGMVFAAHLGVLLEVTPRDLPHKIVESLEQVGLPTTYADHSFAQLQPFMFADKKVRGGHLRFVLLREVADPVVVCVDKPEMLMQAASLTGIPLQ